MKKLLLLIVFSVGCASVNVTETTNKVGSDGKITDQMVTKGSAHFLFAKTAATKIAVAKKTKTTSLLFGASDVTESGDAETLNAFKAAVGDAVIKAAAIAAKP